MNSNTNSNGRIMFRRYHVLLWKIILLYGKPEVYDCSPVARGFGGGGGFLNLSNVDYQRAAL